MRLNFKHTLLACYTGYVVQAIVNTLSPLLFVIYREELGISLVEISILITVNFAVQISMDAGSAFFVKRLGYRASVITAHILATLGFLSLSALTVFLPSSFAALLISTVATAAGGGIIEVVVSPTVEALPGEQKASAMSILHSFYCWGQVAVVLLTTLYLTVFGKSAWIGLPILWALVPAVGAIMFCFVPMNQLSADSSSSRFADLMKSRSFIPLMIIMVASGAAEVAVAWWASLFAELTLNIPKSVSDLVGPCAFAVFMGIVRVLFGKFADKIKLERWICASFALGIVAYLITVISVHPVLSLIGFALCGISVGILWPGTYSLGAKSIPSGGTLMFAFFAIGGDIGCTLGSDLVGIISDAVATNGNGFLSAFINGESVSVGLRTGLLAATAFPIIGFIVSLIFSLKTNKAKKE